MKITLKYDGKCAYGTCSHPATFAEQMPAMGGAFPCSAHEMGVCVSHAIEYSDSKRTVGPASRPIKCSAHKMRKLDAATITKNVEAFRAALLK